MMQTKVAILQHRLLHYRTGLFEDLRTACAERGIELILVHGQPSRQERAKKDEGYLPWAHKVHNIYVTVFGRDLLWQPAPKSIVGAHLVIVMQENRIISNYLWLLRRLFATTKVAYWGHGINFQSRAPRGVRERWKRFLLGRVDWWFAYTSATRQVLEAASFPLERVTCLNNATDTRAFRGDLEAASEDMVNRIRKDLGVPSTARVGVFCGSLYKDKKMDFLIDAVDLVKKRVDAFHCIVIGDGPEMSLLGSAAETRAWFHVTGMKVGMDKAILFRMGEVMLNPGAVGLNVVDAFCAGLAMVTTKSARHGPEVAYLRNGENGCVTGDSVQEYADAIVTLLRDEERLRAMRGAARMDGVKYTLGAMVSNFVGGIQRCLNTPKNGGRARVG